MVEDLGPACRNGGGEGVVVDDGFREALEKVLGFPVYNIESYRQVFKHKSACRDDNSGSYERLEFLGDSILGFIITRHLFETFPDADEGFLTKARTKLVSGKFLGTIARKMGLDQFVVMNEKALKCGWNQNIRILEDVFESLLCAMFYDLGLAATRDFILGVLEKYVDYDELLKDTNYKDAVMRFTQHRGLPLPVYVVLNDPQITKIPCFDVVVTCMGYFGRGRDVSKKNAEQMAAKNVLACLGLLDVCGHVLRF